MFDVVTLQLSGDVAKSGTFGVSYPTNRSAGDYTGAYAHKMYALGADFAAPSDFTVAFGASDITVTYKGATTIPEGSVVRLQLDRLGTDRGRSDATIPSNVTPAPAYLIDLGSPDTADADGVCASQAGTASTAMTINGALASGGVATFDVPRNVVAAWTGTAVLTVTGTDVNGDVVVESSASGTSLAGKKAFKTVTSVVPSANITSATVGTGDVLGLPVFLPDDVYVLAELEDGGAAAAGTIVAGVTSAATATTGDVRGTYDPDTAADGSTAFALLVSLPDPSGQGVPQYAG